jgi:hypothetical protein
VNLVFVVIVMLFYLIRNDAFLDKAISSLVDTTWDGEEATDAVLLKRAEYRGAVVNAAIDAFRWLVEQNGSPEPGWLGEGGWRWESVYTMRFEHPLAVSLDTPYSQ